MNTVHRNYLQQTALAFWALSIAACSSLGPTPVPGEIYPLHGDPSKRKSIFVFLDGTRNNPDSETSIHRLFKSMIQVGDPQLTAIYVPGVGTDFRVVSGSVLGRGVEDRIVRAYEFISKSYGLGDDIYLFGFSRGAHQARAVAGMIAYAGVLPSDVADIKSSHKIVEFLKKKHDEDFEMIWPSWEPEDPPILAEDIKDKFEVDMIYAEVTFMGLWDTVPGSSFKNYPTGACKEDRGFIKKKLWWLIPGIDSGERYKSDSYPPIRRIAHAVARDEKRSKFSPLLICKPIKKEHTKIDEVWFPGAHSDVGGGYGKDSRELPDIPLEWIIGKLEESYKLRPGLALNGSYDGLAHWSICDSPGDTGSHCVDRVPLDGAQMDPSIGQREDLMEAQIKWDGYDEPRYLKYPVNCPKRCEEKP